MSYITPPEFDPHAEAIDGPAPDPWGGYSRLDELDGLGRYNWVQESIETGRWVRAEGQPQLEEYSEPESHTSDIIVAVTIAVIVAAAVIIFARAVWG